MTVADTLEAALANAAGTLTDPDRALLRAALERDGTVAERFLPQVQAAYHYAQGHVSKSDRQATSDLKAAGWLINEHNSRLWYVGIPARYLPTT